MARSWLGNVFLEAYSEKECKGRDSFGEELLSRGDVGILIFDSPSLKGM